MTRGTRSFALLCAAVCLLSACAGRDEEKKKPKLTVPADEATAEERATIDAELGHIESLASDLGQPRSFRDLPVVITDAYTDHPAGCVFQGDEAQFIVMKRSVLEAEADLRAGGIESSLFRVLLHEIGHCYFHRQHEDARISKAGASIELGVRRGRDRSVLRYPLLDATVMDPEALSAPVALERYYVAEILGVARATTLEELKPYADVKYVEDARP